MKILKKAYWTDTQYDISMLIRYVVSIYLKDFKTLPDFDEYGVSIFGNTPYPYFWHVYYSD